MTELDKKISSLFYQMIKSWDKISNIQDGTIKFDNGLSIYAHKKSSKEIDKIRENQPLKLDKSTFTSPYFNGFNWDVIIPDTDKLLFYISTPYRQYSVPEHDRHTYVEVLDILDESIRKFEEKKINEYTTYFE